MTLTKASNCIVCAQEFDSEELHSVALSHINVTRFKICQGCFDQCDPAENYRQAKDIINNYLWAASAVSSFKEAGGILEDLGNPKKL